MPSRLRAPGSNFLETCPVYLLHYWPSMLEVQGAHTFAKLNQDITSRELFPSGIPRIVVLGVIAFEHGIQARLEDDRKDHERELERQEAERKRKHG